MNQDPTPLILDQKREASSVERRAYTINAFTQAFGIGRTKIYEMIADGTLKSVMIGGRRLIPVDVAEELLKSAA